MVGTGWYEHHWAGWMHLEVAWGYELVENRRGYPGRSAEQHFPVLPWKAEE